MWNCYSFILLNCISWSISSILNHICFYLKPSGLGIQESLIYIFLLQLPPQPTHCTLCVSDTFILYCSPCYQSSSGLRCYHRDYCNISWESAVYHLQTVYPVSRCHINLLAVQQQSDHSLLSDLEGNAFEFQINQLPVLHCGMQVLQNVAPICLSVLIFNHFYTNTINIDSLSCNLPSP